MTKPVPAPRSLSRLWFATHACSVPVCCAVRCNCWLVIPDHVARRLGVPLAPRVRWYEAHLYRAGRLTCVLPCTRYLHGHNMHNSPCFMDPIVPTELRSVVKHAECVLCVGDHLEAWCLLTVPCDMGLSLTRYAEYAEPCNRAGVWSAFERHMLCTLKYLYYPVSVTFARWVRRRHTESMYRHHVAYVILC